MSATVSSVIEIGIKEAKIDIECHLSNGLPNIVVVGLGNKAVDEAKERMRSAFAEAGIDLPRKRITLNLAPADLPKDGSTFDLAMAAAIMLAGKQIETGRLADTAVVGELSLDGSVRPVRGIVGKLLACKRLGIRTVYIPHANLEQARLVPDLTLITILSLKDFYQMQTGILPLDIHQSGTVVQSTPGDYHGQDFKEVVGQERAKRALEIAAAGGHNILLSGPPGTGKSMLAKALPSILPPITLDELLAINHIHSSVSQTLVDIVRRRPFRAPHHTASEASILGGGQNPRPGEISLAHHGVLLFDEFPEFGKSIIESLRQPLEDKVITVARAKDTVTYPADFLLVATANPCPCGYYGSNKSCSCTGAELLKYQRKLSGPILDRIDLFLTVDDVKHRDLLSTATAESSSDIRQRVIAARQLQQSRTPGITNATLDNKAIKKHARLEPSAKEILDTAAQKMNLSARAYMRTIRVARTISDLNGQPTITEAEIAEALQYRRPVATI